MISKNSDAAKVPITQHDMWVDATQRLLKLQLRAGEIQKQITEHHSSRNLRLAAARDEAVARLASGERYDETEISANELDRLHRELRRNREAQDVVRRELETLSLSLSTERCTAVADRHKKAVNTVATALEAYRQAIHDEREIRNEIEQDGYRTVEPIHHFAFPGAGQIMDETNTYFERELAESGYSAE